jgi:putative ABC transport system permease protein
MSFGPNSWSPKKHKTRNMKNKKDAPPLLGEKILKIFLPKGESESVAGDYEELYAKIAQTRGKSKAYAWYWIQIAKSIWTGITVYVWWSLAMFRNYLTIALRYLKRHKIYSFINISGLAVGMACCVLILLWINDEIRYDRFHEQTENLYRRIYKKDTNLQTNTQIKAAGGATTIGLLGHVEG